MHPLAVATILAELGMNHETLCAALLHDDRGHRTRWPSCAASSGSDIAELVDRVTKLDKVKYGDAARAETVRKMVVAMSRDIRVLVIKLADRLHNMRTLRYLPRPKQEQKSREVLEIFAPLAHRLGMNTVKWELEDLAFGTLFPKRYDEIARLVSESGPRAATCSSRKSSRTCTPTCARPRSKASVTGRPKHYYSVYQKMIARNVGFDDIYDLVGIRILVESLRDCCRPRHRARGGTGARPVQGLHRDAEVQHVPVAAHHRDRTRGQAGGAADPHLGHAPAG
jgi:GTP pyrophosphokinase